MTEFAIWGPITREDLEGLGDRMSALLNQRAPGVVRCDVAGVEPDAVTVDALCRLQLAARRLGCQLRLENASRELRELIAFMGLTDVLPDGREETAGERGRAASADRGDDPATSRTTA